MITLTAIVIALSLGWVARTLWIHVIAPAVKALPANGEAVTAEVARAR